MQALMINSKPVVIASDQSAVPVSGTVTATGPLTDAQLRAAAVPVSQSGTWTVQPGNTPNTVPWLVSDDWRRNSTPKRYSISVILTPANATALTNLMGLRKQAANADCYLLRFKVQVFQAAAGVAATFGWKRATTVAGGIQVTAADIPKHFDAHVLVVVAKEDDKRTVAFSVASHTQPREKVAESTVKLFKHLKLIS
jgi:hypothetical protein